MEDSGIDCFRDGIIRYLREEKGPLLFMNLADDLQPICIGLQKFYVEQCQNLNSQPREAEAMKSRELAQLAQELHALVKRTFSISVLNSMKQWLVKGISLMQQADHRSFKASM